MCHYNIPFCWSGWRWHLKWHSTENQNVRKQWSEKNAPGLSYDTKHNPKPKSHYSKNCQKLLKSFWDYQSWQDENLMHLTQKKLADLWLLHHKIIHMRVCSEVNNSNNSHFSGTVLAFQLKIHLLTLPL